jgi:hypothetical protein
MATLYIVNQSGTTMWNITIDGTEYSSGLLNNYWKKIQVPAGNDKTCKWYTGTSTLWTILMDIEPGVFTVRFTGTPNYGSFTVYEGDHFDFESEGENGRSSLLQQE